MDALAGVGSGRLRLGGAEEVARWMGRVWSGAGERGRQRPLGRGSARRIFDLLARVLCTSVFSESVASYNSAAIDTRVRCEAGAGAS